MEEIVLNENRQQKFLVEINGKYGKNGTANFVKEIV